MDAGARWDELVGRILDDFNRDNVDDVGPLGGDQSMTLLRDMSELEEGTMNS